MEARLEARKHQQTAPRALPKEVVFDLGSFETLESAKRAATECYWKEGLWRREYALVLLWIGEEKEIRCDGEDPTTEFRWHTECLST